MENTQAQPDENHYRDYDIDLTMLDAAKDLWAQKTIADRLQLLDETKEGIMRVAQGWAEISARKKGLTAAMPVSGEEWLSGPYPTLVGVDALRHTLSQMDGKTFIDHLPTRTLATGRLAVRVLPHSIWDRLILSGIYADVWMQKGINASNLKNHAAIAYDIPEKERKGKVALVLGAGNISSITPLDVLHKLMIENQVVILKMNPINDYLVDYYKIAFKPFIETDALRIVKGDGKVGAYLCDHPLVEELHITGSDKTHDAIVWGVGAEGEKNKKAGTPRNKKRITSELGAVSPTIVVPGPWTSADIQFQAENIATMKLHNSGHNCIATQALIMPENWPQAPKLLQAIKKVAAKSLRPAWYPGTDAKLAEYESHAGNVQKVYRGPNSPALLIGEMNDHKRESEVFGPALGVHTLDAKDAQAYLRAAIAYANDELWGTLGANIIIHPHTIKEIGNAKLEEILADLRYGTIGINVWCGLGFLINSCPWGAYPGHTLDDVQSGIGTVHNSFMLEKTEKTIAYAPWRPFPRGLLSLQFTLLPRPPFFITNKRQDKIGKALTDFQYKPRWWKLPKIFYHALRG